MGAPGVEGAVVSVQVRRAFVDAPWQWHAAKLRLTGTRSARVSSPRRSADLVRRGSPDPAVRLTEGLQLTTGHCSPATRHSPLATTSPGHSSLAPRPLPPAGNWVRFSCSIARLFVLSHNMSLINTTSNWLVSGSFPTTAI